MLLSACGEQEDISNLDKWVVARQMPGAEFIEKLQYDKHYFVLFRLGQKIILRQRIFTNETAIGGYSSSLSVDDAEGQNPNVVDAKTRIDSTEIFQQDARIYKERSISLEINKEYEGTLHVVYRWRPVRSDEVAEDVNSEQVLEDMVDPIVFDVETFWIQAS